LASLLSVEESAQESADNSRGAGTIAMAAYIMLFLAGVMQAVVGAFYYSSGPAPLAALGFDVLLLATCLLAAWGMRRPAAGLMPAVGWFVAAFVLAMGTKGGSVLITNTSAGEWFLFGGAACAAAGALAAFARWSRTSARRRGILARRKTGL
jgi:hypothetical protein